MQSDTQCPRSPSVMTARSNRRFSLTSTLRDLVNLFIDPFAPSPSPFDPSPSTFRQHHHHNRSLSSASSSTATTRSSRRGNSSSSFSSFDSGPTPTLPPAGCPPHKSRGVPAAAAGANPAEGQWAGEGPDRHWTSPTPTSTFPSRPSHRRRSRISSFSTNEFKFAATFAGEGDADLSEEDVAFALPLPLPPPPPAPLPTPTGDDEDDEEDAAAVVRLQAEFARSELSHRRRGAVSSASVSLPSSRGVGPPLEYFVTGGKKGYSMSPADVREESEEGEENDAITKLVGLEWGEARPAVTISRRESDYGAARAVGGHRRSGTAW